MYNMKQRIWLRIISLILILAIGGLASAQDAQSDLLSRINNLRASLGLPHYRLNGALNAAAANHAAWMASTGQISHTQWDGSTPRNRAATAGYSSSFVSENIYMGSNASPGSAWSFWINSPIHYKGLTSPNYDEVGIAEAIDANGRAYVLVFGSSSGATIAAAARAVANNASDAQAAAPSFVVGLDEKGNIMHEIQPGDTLGDIALIYGYTWDDLPYMLEINSMTWDDIREILPGSVFLVPPKSGTYTPTPDNSTEQITATPPAENPAEQADVVSMAAQPTGTPASDNIAPTSADSPPVAPSNTPAPIETINIPVQLTSEPVNINLTATPTEELTHNNVVVEAMVTDAALTITPSPTFGIQVRALPVATRVASAGTPEPRIVAPIVEETPEESPAGDGPPLWLISAVLLQVGVLGVATFQFFKRR